MDTTNSNFKPAPMPTPTLVVSKKDYEDIILKRVTPYIIKGRKGLKVAPRYAQEIGENKVVYLGAPKEIKFRRRFSREKSLRGVMMIEADNSDRYELVTTIYLKA